MRKLSAKQKKYLTVIVDNCKDKGEFIRAYYGELDFHLDHLDAINSFESLEFEVERFINDYWNSTKFTQYQF